MSETDLQREILAFAQHLGRGRHEGAAAEAAQRRWIDDQGRPTRDGASLVDALFAQRDTRTVFRGNF